MKKITLSLLAFLGLTSIGLSQATYNLVRPTYNNAVSAFRAPNGTAAYAYQRTVMFIHEWEMLPMNLCTINSIGFQYTNGTGAGQVVGNFTLYLENTTDQDLLKPNSFSAITSSIAPSYVGTYTVPGGTGPATVNLSMTTPFNYTGGGLYVLWDFQSSGPFAANAATLASNSDETGWLWYNNAASAPANTFSAGTLFRPALIFNATNNANNEVELVRVETDGKVSKLENSTAPLDVVVCNSSIGAASNVSVQLVGTGANPTTAVSVLASMAPGSFSVVSFQVPTAVNGLTSFSAAALFADQDLTNNLKTTNQSVSCNTVGLGRPTDPISDYTSLTVGNGIITTFVHQTGASSSSITSVSVITPSFTSAGNLGKQLYPVVADAGGNIVATGNTVTLASANLNTWNALSFSSPIALSPNTVYLFGVGTTTSGYFPVGASPAYNVPGYYLLPIGGGSAPVEANFGHLALEASLATSATTMAAVATKTAVCKGSPQQVTITATGADSYTYSIPGLGSGGSAVWTPSVANTNSFVIVNISGSYTTGAAAGCKANTNASIRFDLLACNGLMDNGTAEGIAVFPNPAVAGKATITGLNGGSMVTVFNSVGQLMFTRSYSSESVEIDLSSYPAGNYLVKVTNAANESHTLRVINQ